MQARKDDKEAKDYFKVDKGQLTFDVEGDEGGPYHSRTAHWPGGKSGVTIGRGYDMGAKTADKIIKDLMSAGLEKTSAEKFSKCAGKQGETAKNYLAETAKKKEDVLPEITAAVQHALFVLIYNELMTDMKRILKKHAIEFDALHNIMQDILVDLRFRGDYHDKHAGEILRPSLKANNLDDFIKEIENEKNWSDVNEKRRKARVAYCASKKQQEVTPTASAAAASSSLTGNSLFKSPAKPAAKPMTTKSAPAAVKPR